MTEIRDGFRVFRGEDGQVAVAQLVDGRVYPLEPSAEVKRLKPGYYDADFARVEDDEVVKHADHDQSSHGQGGGESAPRRAR